MDKRKMIKLYEQYGFTMPLKGVYKRKDSRIYFSNDFKDSEIIEFFWNCENQSACAIGNAFYMNKEGISNLINISEIMINN